MQPASHTCETLTQASKHIHYYPSVTFVNCSYSKELLTGIETYASIFLLLTFHRFQLGFLRDISVNPSLGRATTFPVTQKDISNRAPERLCCEKIRVFFKHFATILRNSRGHVSQEKWITSNSVSASKSELSQAFKTLNPNFGRQNSPGCKCWQFI
jgi:hypothetical protein